MTIVSFFNKTIHKIILCIVLFHQTTNASEDCCSDEIAFQVIKSDLDMSNVSKIRISTASFAVDTKSTTTTFENVTITIEPHDGKEIVISSNSPNLFNPRFFGGNDYKATNGNNGFVNEEDCTTLVFERDFQLEVENDNKIGLAIKFPKYKLLDLYIDTYYAIIYVLPGFDNLRNIHSRTNVTLYAELTAPFTNFTMGNSVGKENETQLGNITYFTIETDNSSSFSYGNFISMIF